MEAPKPGWIIHGQMYEHVGSAGLTHGDLALIREVTGLTLDEFDEVLDELSLAGWMAVAFWHANQELRREQVVRFVERLPRDNVEMVGWNTPASGDGGPPAEEPEEVTSDGSSTTSDATPEAETSTATGSSAGPARPK